MPPRSRPSRRARVADRLHSASIHLLRRVRERDGESGLSPARLSALSVLVFGGPRSVGGLAAAEQVRPPTMTNLVHGLESDGLVVRKPSSTDGRKTEVHATAKGRRLMARARAARLAALEELVAGLTRDELAILERAGEILSDVLG